MPKAKNTKQVQITLETKVTSYPSFEAKYQSVMPFLGKARHVSLRDGEVSAVGELIKLHECVGQLGKIYDCLYGNKGAERPVDWKPSDSEAKRAREVKKQLKADYGVATAKGPFRTAITLNGQAGEVVAIGRERVVRDRVTKDLVRRETTVRVGTAFSVKEIYTDKLARHRANGEAIKAWAKAQGLNS